MILAILYLYTALAFDKTNKYLLNIELGPENNTIGLYKVSTEV